MKFQIFVFAIVVALGLMRNGWTAEVSITMDDFDIHESTLLNAQERNQKILNTFDQHEIKSTLFVRGKHVDSPQGKALLKEWDQKGHAIANHTYSHWSYHSPKVSFEMFSQDLLRADALIQDLQNFERRFRFPFLHEGNTSAKVARLREFLRNAHYQMGYVTIDASDWYIDDRMRARLQKNPTTDLSSYRDYFLKHIWDRSVYYNELSKKVLGREVKHTLLLHFNLLNSIFLDDLVKMFKKQGWKVISSSEAFSDPVFQMEPKIAPAGNSILWGLAKETGKYESILRNPGEDGEYEKEPMDSLGL